MQHWRIEGRAGWTLPVLAAAVLALVGALLFGDGLSSSSTPGRAQAADESRAATGPWDPNAIVDVVDRVGPAVVLIEVTYRAPSFQFGPEDFWWFPFPQPPRENQASGTGFIISPDGYIMTNQHVAEVENGIARIDVTVEGYDEPLPARLVSFDRELDLALLKVETEEPLPVAPLGDSEATRVGEWVIAIGNPYGFEHTVTVGVLSAKGREIPIYEQPGQRQPTRVYRNLMQTDAAINRGNSGGPLLNLRGEVVGINTAVASQAQGIGFAIPINTAKEVVEELIELGQEPRPLIGISYTTLDDRTRQACGLRTRTGIVIMEVLPGTAAEEAGLRACDAVVRVDSQRIGNQNDFQRAVEGMQPGTRFLFLVERQGREFLAEVEVGEQYVPRERGS